MDKNFSEILDKKIEETSALYVVSTPIGNMGDITLRAISTLSQVDTIVCEDTRTSGILLSRFGIKKPLISFHAKSKGGDIEKIIDKLEKGERLAYISDAGTPGISDPICLLIQKIKESELPIKIIPIPGPSAITAIVSVSGIAGNHFTFLGFIPQKNGRKKFIEDIKKYDHMVVLYESPHRVEKTIKEISEYLGKETKIIIGRELTKQFEETFSGGAEELLNHPKIKNPKGEYVIVIDNK